MTFATLTTSASPTTTQWLTDLDQAIRLGDDEGLWHVLAQHTDQVEAHHRLATQVARLAYLVGGRPRFSELFLVPIIEPAGMRLLQAEEVWRQADICINEALQSWLPPKSRKTVFAGIQPYDWIGGWRPNILRCHLQSTIPGQQLTVTFLTETIDCPVEAPRLGFICMVVTSERGWPRVPDVDTLRDTRFKSVVSYALQGSPSSPQPTVLPPDRLQYAVADGLALWLHQLHLAVPITGWTAAPNSASPDVVKVTLALDSETVRVTQFTMRKHQIGLEGVGGVLTMLQSLAPTLDMPMDLPERKQERRTLDLT